MSSPDLLTEAIERLRFGSQQGRWSAELTSAMCRAVLDVIEPIHVDFHGRSMCGRAGRIQKPGEESTCAECSAAWDRISADGP